jgi:hypothetical protein
MDERHATLLPAGRVSRQQALDFYPFMLSFNYYQVVLYSWVILLSLAHEPGPDFTPVSHPGFMRMKVLSFKILILA